MHPHLAAPELQPLCMYGAHDGQIDILLHIHVHVVVGAENVIHHLELETALNKLQEVCSVELGELDTLDIVAHFTIDRLNLLCSGPIRDHKSECDAARFH